MFALQVSLLLCGLSAIYAQEVVPYRFPMLLGRGYDLKEHRVGADLYSIADTSKVPPVANTHTIAQYKMVKTNKDANDFLNVNGALSLKVKGGMLNFEGSGSYLRHVQNREEVVEILVKHKFNTVKKTLHTSTKASPDCLKLSPRDRGTHYIRSVQYGGNMVASLRFISTSSREKQDIEAAIKGSVGAEGKFGLEVEGKFKQLKEKTNGEYRIEYSIYATSLLDKTPGTIEEFLKVIEEFPTKAKQQGAPGGIGVPIEVELYPIDSLPGCQPYPPVNWKQNSFLNGDVEDLEAKFDDIRVSRNVFNTWSRNVDLNIIKEEVLVKFGNFNKKMRDIDRVIRKTISSLDLSYQADPFQFDDAIDAYAPSGNDYNNVLYRNELRKLQNDVRETGCTSKKCPSGSLSLFGNCYIFKTGHSFTWADAKTQCQTIYGNAAQLAYFGSTQEADQISAAAYQRIGTGHNSYWIGGRRSLSSHNRWVWDNSGQATSVSRWTPGEPNNSGGREHCMEIRGNYHTRYAGRTWNDLNCDIKRGYICKLKPACAL